MCVPEAYTVVDTETTGLNAAKDRLIEIGAVRIRGGKETARFSELIDPGRPIPARITQITGISDRDVRGCRTEKEVLRDFLAFLGDDIIVGHNVQFDVSFLYAAAERCFHCGVRNQKVDTLRMSRLVLKEVYHHRLSDLADRYGIDRSHAHRAVHDCEITQAVLVHLADEARARYGGLDELARHPRLPVYPKAAEITPRKVPDVNGPFYGQVIAFSGVLRSMDRREAMQAAADRGAILADTVTARTDVLVLAPGPDHRKSAKQRKAEALLEKGGRIRVITEELFLMLLGE